VNVHFGACAQNVCHQQVTCSETVASLVNHNIDNDLFTVKPSLYQSFSQVIDVMNLCFVHALLRNTANK